MTKQASTLQIKYHLTQLHSFNSALGHHPVVGGNWLQSSIIHRVWQNGVTTFVIKILFIMYQVPVKCLDTHTHA